MTDRTSSARSARDQDGAERGLVLLLVLAILLMTSLMLTVLVSYLSAGLHAGTAYQGRIDKVQRNADAVTFAVNAIRNNATLGRAGTTSSWIYNGVTVTCTGDAGSGVASGLGRTDRTVTCSTPVIRSQVRYFDRGGSGVGIVTEQLSWTVLI